MNDIENMINRYGILPGDAIEAKKLGFGILNHYAVYVGQDKYGKHHFMVNTMKDGVRYFDEQEVSELLESFSPKRVKRLEGNDYERRAAVQRAFDEEGKKYHLLMYNCESFMTYVQTGVRSSKQVNIAGALLFFSLLIVGVAKSK